MRLNNVAVEWSVAVEWDVAGVDSQREPPVRCELFPFNAEAQRSKAMRQPPAATKPFRDSEVRSSSQQRSTFCAFNAKTHKAKSCCRRQPNSGSLQNHSATKLLPQPVFAHLILRASALNGGRVRISLGARPPGGTRPQARLLNGPIKSIGDSGFCVSSQE